MASRSLHRRRCKTAASDPPDSAGDSPARWKLRSARFARARRRERTAEDHPVSVVQRQIVPSALAELLRDEDPANLQRVMKAMRGMTRIEIQKLQDVYDAKIA
jgi:hypothetical protein